MNNPIIELAAMFALPQISPEGTQIAHGGVGRFSGAPPGAVDTDFAAALGAANEAAGAGNEGSAQAHGTLSTSLTSYATGWDGGGDVKRLLDFVAKPVPAPDGPFEYLVGLKDDANVVVEENDLKRAILQPFRMIGAGGTKSFGTCINKGLMTAWDVKSQGHPGKKESMVRWLLGIILRSELVHSIAAIDKAATAVADDWTAADANPDILIKAQRRAAKGDNAGILANRVLMGGGLWDEREKFYSNKDGNDSARRATKTPKQFGDYIGAEVEVTELVQTTRTVKGKDIVDDNVYYLFHSESNSTHDASNVKRFVGGGGRTRVHSWRDQTGNTEYVAVEHRSLIVASNGDGIRKCTVTP